MAKGSWRRRFILVVYFFCVIMLAGSVNGEGEKTVIFKEDWNSGAKIFSPNMMTGEIGLAQGMHIDSQKWNVRIGQKMDGSKCELEQLDAGDWAIFTEGLSIKAGNDHSTWFYSKKIFRRGGNLRCTFKTWVDASKKKNWVKGAPEYAQIGGPWHCSPSGPVWKNPEAVIRYWVNPRFAQAGDPWPLGGHPMSSNFIKAFQASHSKSTALTIRVWLGDRIGAKLEWSPDSGQIWNEEIDVRDKKGSKDSEAYLGFATYGAAVFIDDIVVECDAAPAPNSAR